MKVKQILLTILLEVLPFILFATDYYTATIKLNVRTGAGQGYAVFYTLQQGDEVEFLSKENNWYKIQYSGKVGYAYSKYFKYSRNILGAKIESPQSNYPFALLGVVACLAFIIRLILLGKNKRNRVLKRSAESGRGTRSERDLALQLLRSGIPEQRIFHDLYLEKYDNHFSQIDLVILTEVGIIVFEVKDYSGWIFGRGYQSQWTKVLNYGKEKYRFYNPIKQNNTHIAELRKQLLQFDHIPFYSIVVFYGDCELREIDFVPSGTFIVKSHRVLEVLSTILNNNKVVQYANEDEIVRMLKEAVVKGEAKENQLQHNENIKDMLGKHRIFD
ncbi:hypothetical protein BH11BAC4_BH11BAC4_26570 [soil metagenome]